MKRALMIGAAYCAAGVAVIAWTVALDASGKPHFGDKGSAVGGLAKTFLLWPWAAVVNLKGG